MTHRLWPSLGLDLVTLRVFVAAAEEGNLARAAEREHLSQSAASRRISDFELRAGVTLFERRDRGMVPTIAGTHMLAQLRDIFERLDRVALDLESARSGEAGHVRVHAPMSAMASRLPDQIASFAAAHPTISVELIEQTSIEVVHAVKTGLADIGIVSIDATSEDLVFSAWATDHLVAVLPPAHRLADSTRLTLAELIDEPFIAMQESSTLTALYRLHASAIGRQLTARAYATSFGSVCHLVALGLGVSIVPNAAAHGVAGIVVRPLDEPWAHRTLRLCVRAPARLTAASRRMFDHLTSE